MTAASAYLAAYARALRPEPVLTVSEWADQYRVLDQAASAEAGPWRTSRTPYLREIMDCLSSSEAIVQQVVFMKGAQIGATEAGNCWLGYIIHHAPAPTLYVMPTTEMVKRASKQRIAPLLDSTPELRERIASPRSRDSGNTIQMKEFDGGALVMTGANSAVGLRSMPARYLFMDEIDAYPGDLDGEGDPIALAMKRTSTFKRNRKIFMPSTPTVRGLSHIERFFESSDKRHYFVPCPHCEHMQTISWDKITWTDNDPTTAKMACERCGATIDEAHKTDMLEHGVWRPTAETTDPTVRGYHLSALYSPLGWYSWSDAVKDFLAAKSAPELLKTWVNTTLGETWEEAGDGIDEAPLFARREDYDPETLPIALITAGVDVQKDRIEATIVGWGEGEEAWILAHEIIPGDTAQDDVWLSLDAVLQDAGVVHAAIDSGYNATQVYAFTAQRRWTTAIKGVPGMGRAFIEDSRKRLQRLRRARKSGAYAEPVGVDSGKVTLKSRLAQSEPGAGYIHFPLSSDCDEEYFSQLAAEKLVTRYRSGKPYQEWIAMRPRNEALDCLVYALAACRLSNVDLSATIRRQTNAAIIPPAQKAPTRARTSSALL